MYILLVGIHLIVCFVLIAVILLQAGRGGGLSEMFGGGATQTILGTKATAFLARATTVCATVFILTSLVLAIVTAARSRSLMRERMLRQELPTQETPAPIAE